MKQKIGIDEIRKGDLIRQEWNREDGEYHQSLVVEYRAKLDEAGYWSNRVANTFLLDRHVRLPTRPYAVVAPPEESDGILSPYILRPSGKGLDWYRAGTFAHDYEVLDDLKNGWRVVFEGVEDDE